MKIRLEVGFEMEENLKVAKEGRKTENMLWKRSKHYSSRLVHLYCRFILHYKEI